MLFLLYLHDDCRSIQFTGHFMDTADKQHRQECLLQIKDDGSQEVLRPTQFRRHFAQGQCGSSRYLYNLVVSYSVVRIIMTVSDWCLYCFSVAPAVCL